MGLSDVAKKPERLLRRFGEGPDQVFEALATPEEKIFIETYLQCGNALASALKMRPALEKSQQYARNLGCKLVKKFNLKGKTKAIVTLKNRTFNLETNKNLADLVKQKYLNGEINEETLFVRMDNLSQRSQSDQARFNATKEMRQWLKEAKQEVDASRLSQLDIVQLMRDALSALPKDRYLGVLRETRRKRQEIIKERNIIYDPDKIREKERTKFVNGGTQWQ